MPWKLNLSTVAVIFASWLVIATLEDSCKDLESIKPCDMYSQLEVEFGKCGVRVRPERAKTAPRVSYEEAEEGQMYVLVMVDPDAPSAKKPTSRYWRHWVMSDIRGSSLKYRSAEGAVWTEYNGPSPPAGSGPHRYQMLLFEQLGRLQSLSGVTNNNRGSWNLSDFARKNALCDRLVASGEFISENK